jgi:hypothetical protein
MREEFVLNGFRQGVEFSDELGWKSTLQDTLEYGTRVICISIHYYYMFAGAR